MPITTLTTGLICGLVFGQLFALHNIVFETIRFSIASEWFRKSLFLLRKGLVIGLLYALTLGLISGLFFGLSGLITGLIFGLMFWLTSWLISVLFFEPRTDLKTRLQPNQDIKISTRNAVIILSIGWSVMIVFFFYKQIFDTGIVFAIVFLFFTYLTFVVSLIGGGKACIQHFALRCVLFRSGVSPWNYARFLDYASERLLMQRVGGRYRFIHKLLQDHFAEMSLSPPCILREER